ncbi:MAG: septum formation initiator family protein [Actinomycetota bacterium]|nr:septum formation initiator family protein [Actinomycetota bacterium]
MPRTRITVRAVVLAALVLVLAIAASVPVRQFLAQRAEIAELEQQVGQLEANNDSLRAEIERLHDPQELERIARECLGMVRPGEIKFVDPAGPRPDSC